jgi:hypothetical protein
VAQAYLIQEDVANYGTEFIDFTQRAAAHAITPQLQRISDENRRLRLQLAIETRKRLDERVEMARVFGKTRLVKRQIAIDDSDLINVRLAQFADSGRTSSEVREICHRRT